MGINVTLYAHFFYFSSHSIVFASWASSLPSNRMLNTANKKSVTFSDWHWCSHTCHIGDRAAYFSYQNVIVDTIISLQGSDVEVISMSEVHEFLTKIHDILDGAFYKWVGNTACILACVF